MAREGRCCAAFAVAISLLLHGCGMSPDSDITTTTTTTAAWGPADCFVVPTYADVDITVNSGLTYGRAYNKFTRQNETLKLDTYSPPSTSANQKRPALVLLHGGSFTEGSRTSDQIPRLATQFAMRGYVAVSIDYRLSSFEWFASHLYMLEELASVAQEDARAAVRFLRSRAGDLHIDTNRIAVGGDSAGAIAALYYAYVPDAPEGTSGNPGYSSSVSAVLSISGAMKMQAYCVSIDKVSLQPSGCLLEDGQDLTNDIVGGDPPLAMVHGTLDTVIPFLNAEEMSDRAKEVGVRNIFIQGAGIGHVPDIMNTLFNTANQDMANLTRFMSGVLNLAQVECPAPAVREVAHPGANASVIAIGDRIVV